MRLIIRMKVTQMMNKKDQNMVIKTLIKYYLGLNHSIYAVDSNGLKYRKDQILKTFND